MINPNSQTIASPLFSEHGSKETIIKFIFNDSTFSNYSFSQLEDINPSFLFNHSFNKTELNLVEVIMPTDLTSKGLEDFIILFKHGISEYTKESTDTPDRLLLILKTSEYFDQKEFSTSLIQELVLPNLFERNSFQFLLMAYEKLSHSNNQHNDSYEQCWFELFFQSLETLGKSVSHIIENIPQLMTLDHKIAEEVINKCFASLFIGNYKLVDDIQSDNSLVNDEDYFNRPNVNSLLTIDLEKIIKMLYCIRKCSESIYSLLTNEYMLSCSSQSLNEINNRKTPTFLVKIPIALDHFYEEYPLNMKLNGKEIVLIIFYKKNEDSLNVNLKLNDRLSSSKPSSQDDLRDSFNIITLLSSVIIDEDEATCQMNVKSVSNNKSSISIFKQNNMAKCFEDRAKRGSKDDKPDNANFALKINLKVCYTHSVLSSFLLKCFPKYYNNAEIAKLPKDFISLLLKSKYLNHEEDQIAIALMNWLDDDVNITENVNELIEGIKWDKVDERLIFEFIIKYGNMIDNEETRTRIIKGLHCKYSLRTLRFEEVLDKIGEDLFDAARAIDYSSLFLSLKKKAKVKDIPQSPMNNNPTSSTSIKVKQGDYFNSRKSDSILTHYNKYDTAENNNQIDLPLSLNYFPSSSNNASYLNIKRPSRKRELNASNQSLSQLISKDKSMISRKDNKPTTEIVKKEELLGKFIQQYKSKLNQKGKEKRKERLNPKKPIRIRTQPNQPNDITSKSLSNLLKEHNASSVKINHNKVTAKSMSHLILETQPSTSQKKIKTIPLTKLSKKTRNNNKGSIDSPQGSIPSSILNTISYYKNGANNRRIVDQNKVFQLFNISKVNHCEGKK